MTGDLSALLNASRTELSASPITPRHLADLVKLVTNDEISSAGAKTALAQAFSTGEDIGAIVEAKGLRQVSDSSALDAVIDAVIAENPGPVEQFRKGKEGVLGFLVGQVMRKTNGSANPKVAGDLLRQRLAAD
jgi:aspartyl-tRNA(Asn)/glutamyl-tRNA(Gln) amidotransferase subunit B